jgi:hypothetical protein
MNTDWAAVLLQVELNLKTRFCRKNWVEEQNFTPDFEEKAGLEGKREPRPYLSSPEAIKLKLSEQVQARTCRVNLSSVPW